MNMNKKKRFVLALSVTAALSAVSIGSVFGADITGGFTTLPYTEQESAAAHTADEVLGAKVSGTVTKLDNGQIRIQSSDPNALYPEIILNITDETRVLDGAEGYPVNLADVADGSYIYAYTVNFMTMSLPPISNAVVVICNTPEDMAAPEFKVIQSAQMAADGQSVTITATDGDEFEADKESTLLPYLTRNMIFLDSLQPGNAILVWKTSEGLEEIGPGVPSSRALKIVLFPETYSVQADTQAQ